LVATCSVIVTSRGPRVTVMWHFLTPSLDTSLRQGDVGGANRSGRRLRRSLVLAPMPRGTDTARLADRS